MKHKITQYFADEIELTIEEVSTQLNQADFTVTATEGKAKEWLLSYDDKEYGHLSLVTEKDNEFTASTKALLTISSQQPLVSKLLKTLHENTKSVLSFSLEHTVQEATEHIKQLDPILEWLNETYLGAMVINDHFTFLSKHDHHEIWQLNSYEESPDKDDDKDYWLCEASAVKDDFHLDLLCYSDETKHQLTIDYKDFYLAVDLPGPQIIQELIDYFKDTLRTGKYQDTYLGLGSYQYMAEKSCCLGYLNEQAIKIAKCGECDEHYYLRYSSDKGQKGNLIVSLKAEVIDKFVATLNEVQEELEVGHRCSK